MKKKVVMLCFAVVAVAGCHPTPPYSAQTSEIVQQVEAAGSGDVNQMAVPELMHFMDTHVRLAVRLQSECKSVQQAGNPTWSSSQEGKVCAAVGQQDRVKQLAAYETLKAQELKNGDTDAVARIEAQEGK
jgi:hypothetical protein